MTASSLPEPCRSRGFTLIELMIALVLSLFVLASLVQLYLHSKRYYRFQDAAAQVQGNGRFAVELMSYHLRLAGYREDKPAQGALMNAIVADASRDGGGSEPDQIAIQYESMSDCTGQQASGGTPQKFVFLFKVDNDGGLVCNGEQIVAGVENLQILYGEDTDDDGVANRYLNRDQVVNLEKVVALRLALLIASDEFVGGSDGPKNFELANTTIPEKSDGRLRSVYSTTVSLRNGNIDFFSG